MVHTGQPPALGHLAPEPSSPEQEAEAAIHDWTKAHKINVPRKKLARNEKGEVRYRLFECGHAGKPQNTSKKDDSDRQRPMTSSKQTGCEMRISIVVVSAHNTPGPWKSFTQKTAVNFITTGIHPMFVFT